MKRYKVYAKILGYVLPDTSIEINNCKIEKMSYREQKERNFQPLKGWKVREFNMNYMTFPRGADFRVMRSNFIVSTVLDCSGPNEALGLAEIIFDKLIGTFMLYMAHWWPNKHSKSKIRFSDYDYLICKLYEIVDDKEIEVRDLRPTSSSASMCHYPAFKELTTNSNEIIEQYINCKDEIFEKSLKYFTNGIKGLHKQLPEEKVFLDLFKTIELIIKNFENKKKKRREIFKKIVKRAKKELGLSHDDEKKINRYWNMRSNGDFAHATARKSFLPPQYPNPGDCEPFVNYFELIDLSQKVLINYFNYSKNRYVVLINPPDSHYLDKNCLTFVVKSNIIYTSWDNGYFGIRTDKKNKRKLAWFIKKEVARYLKVKTKQIRVLKHKNNKMILKILCN